MLCRISGYTVVEALVNLRCAPTALKGENQLPKVAQRVKFQNGIEVIELPAHHAA